MTAASYRGVPDWTQGTATINNGQRNVTLTNSGIIATDAASGLDYSAVRSGDFFVVDGVGYGLITDVAGVAGATTATVTLATNWTAATQTAVAYRVIRMSMPSTGEVRALMQQLLARGDRDSPFTKFYTDDSTGRLVVDPHSGAPGLYVGQTGVSDAALLAALTADRATGAVSFPNSVKGWSLTGERNRLRNATFSINQRVVSGTVTLAAGAYGHDGVKAGSAGATYTFAVGGLDTTITISAGSLIMPVEDGVIEGGAYVLSHEGSAQARIWQGTGYAGSGSYATASRSAPLAVTELGGNTQTNAEFASGTILLPQLEPGAYASAFERRLPQAEIELCQRYYSTSYNNSPPGSIVTSGAMTCTVGATNNYQAIMVFLPTRMRSSPTVTLYSPATGLAGKIADSGGDVAAVVQYVGGSSFSALVNNVTVSTGHGLSVHYVASSEI